MSQDEARTRAKETIDNSFTELEELVKWMFPQTTITDYVVAQLGAHRRLLHHPINQGELSTEFMGAVAISSE